MFISWIKRLCAIFFIMPPLYSYSINVSMPCYSKFDASGKNEYELILSNDGVIQSISCKYSESTYKNWTFEDKKNIDVQKENKDFGIIVKVFGSTYFKLKNSMVYTAYKTLDNIQERYEFINISNDFAQVLCSVNRGEPDENVYDTYLERIEIHGKRFFSKSEEDQIHNLKMVMRTGISEVLMPYILCDEQNFFKNNLIYMASSELKEDNVIYSSQNLESLDGNPWATSDLNKAEVFIDIPVKSVVKIAVYNGFQSTSKKYLYYSNSRAKEVRITNLSSKKTKTVNLTDTSEKQIIDLTDLTNNEGEIAKIKFQVTSVYSGSKYKDLCIQAILLENNY